MTNNRIVVTIILAIPALFIAALSCADTVSFTNGGAVEGIIKSENADNIEVDIGFGTITCARREIARIERSAPAENTALTGKWERKREDLKASEAEFAAERKRRFEEYDAWLGEERERREKAASDSGAIDLARDPASKNILVSALIDGKVKTTLILDTGASIVVLTKAKGEELGIDLADTKNTLATLQLAGDHKIAAKMVMLKSVRINDIEVKDVLAGILLEDTTSSLKDGLLGMTFLSRFNLKIDLKNMKMALEKAG